jgi:hypothetical protein
MNRRNFLKTILGLIVSPSLAIKSIDSSTKSNEIFKEKSYMEGGIVYAPYTVKYIEPQDYRLTDFSLVGFKNNINHGYYKKVTI